MSDLPRGWVEAKLSNVISQGGLFTDGDWVESKDQDPDGDVRLTQLADVGEGRFRDRSNRFLTADKARELRCTFLERNDVLVARMPDPLGRACLFPGDSQPCVTVVDVCIVRPGANGVDSRWLMWWINTPRLRRDVLALQSGTTRKRISRKNFATIAFPVPPLAEQRRIVAAIEEHFSRLDAAEASLRQAEARCRSFRAAILNEAVATYPRTQLGELVGALRYGTSVKCLPDAQGPPVLRIPNVRGGRIDLTDLKSATVDATGLGDCFVEEGDLLFVRTNGSRDLIGRVAVVTGVDRPAFASYLIRARPDPSILDPRWAVLTLSSPSLRAVIESKAATTAGQYNLNLQSLRSLEVPLPSLPDQRRIVAEVERRLSLVDALAAATAAALKRSAALRRSILERAFTGKLAPQDPHDEPASVLLERIRAERADQEPHPRATRR